MNTPAQRHFQSEYGVLEPRPLSIPAHPIFLVASFSVSAAHVHWRSPTTRRHTADPSRFFGLCFSSLQSHFSSSCSGENFCAIHISATPLATTRKALRDGYSVLGRSTFSLRLFRLRGRLLRTGIDLIDEVGGSRNRSWKERGQEEHWRRNLPSF